MMEGDAVERSYTLTIKAGVHPNDGRAWAEAGDSRGPSVGVTLEGGDVDEALHRLFAQLAQDAIPTPGHLALWAIPDMKVRAMIAAQMGMQTGGRHDET